MTANDPRVEIARSLFAAWSSGDADAPERFFAPEGVLFDNVSGRFDGWPAIRSFFARGLARVKDLTLIPDELWTNDQGVAVHYVMSAEILPGDPIGEQYAGRRWSVEALSYLHITDGLVVYEADFHDKGGRLKSLGLT
jgi:hypothetical protein